MKLYHTSDSLQLGEKLNPEFHGHRWLMEPFLEALRRSEDCFYGMMLGQQYLYYLFQRQKWANWSVTPKHPTEAVFEYIRQTEFPEHASRISSNYFYDDLNLCKYFYHITWSRDDEEYRQRVHMYEIETDQNSLTKRDMRLYDMGLEAIRDRMDIQAAKDAARRYFAGEQTDDPVWEYLSEQEAVAAVDVTHLLLELLSDTP